MSFHRHNQGFSLLEALITTGLIVVLSGICVPLYSDYLIRANRDQAKTALAKLSVALELYQINHLTYNGATLAELGFASWRGEKHYRLSLDKLTQNTYVLSAIPLATQLRADRACGTLSLNSFGEHSHTGSAPIDACW